MDQVKIGGFISKLRKNKNMTQQELADKLSVTDRAISNWERGIRMPDISFFKPLCEILGISVSELINGEEIPKEKYVSSSDEIVIKTLNTNQKNKRKATIGILFAVLLLVLLIILTFIITHKKAYPKLDIYSFALYNVEDNPSLTHKFTYKSNQKTHNVYYYGIEYSEICDSKDNCYEIKNSINNNQISIEDLKIYFDKQLGLGNNKMFMLYDGGTTIYENSRYQVILCNTINGNKDVYFGINGMLDDLDGEYCGHEKNTVKKFIRTYYITSVSLNNDDQEVINVTLKQFNGETATVKINKSNNIVVGKTYEFSFYAFDEFKDTIENIFYYSTLLDIKETDKIGEEQINETIYVNEDIKTSGELDKISMTIEEGTLTKTSATVIIKDLSGYRSIYGSSFKIERYEDGIWKEAEKTGENYAFNSMAYGVDINNILRMEHDWSHIYKPLKSGKYRLVKDVHTTKQNYLFVEFTIE